MGISLGKLHRLAGSKHVNLDLTNKVNQQTANTNVSGVVQQTSLDLWIYGFCKTRTCRFTAKRDGVSLSQHRNLTQTSGIHQQTWDFTNKEARPVSTTKLWISRTGNAQQIRRLIRKHGSRQGLRQLGCQYMPLD